MYRHTRKSKAAVGFSLVELLVVVGIMALLATIAFNTLGSFSKSQSLSVGTSATAQLLEHARSLSVAGADGAPHGVHFASSTLTLFAGSSYSASDPANEVTTLPGELVVLTLSLVGGGTDVIFDQITGATRESGSATLQIGTDMSRRKTMQISSAGIVSVQ